ncbi:DEKNAAC101393 [Brettanomyces naardenensis]|uniref:Ribosome-releasing factor 2, mitochondrial n=1 Tax=Brettanomyces naardenensis TaxID=13370 RepID=A0A448YHF8_BRENA|nr:DEKNAAC101393 [Brettanomyces naardenensis]
MFIRKAGLVRSFLGSFSSISTQLRYASSSAASSFDYQADLPKIPIENIRNIGIIAHIDAGKTTTTERMLFYSGLISRIGNVDEGDTVTDYLTEEKDRGITIQSAAVTVPWNRHKINVLDTPGHADFAFEVIRSLRVLDGAVTILDAVAGVEAQTEKVWRQAKDLGIPLIAYINKMDREGAGYGRSVREIVGRLGTRALLVNIPYFVEDPITKQMIFKGVIDVVERKLLSWETSDRSNEDGRKVSVIDLDLETDQNAELRKECKDARQALIEQLGDYDEHVIDSFLETEDYMQVSSSIIKDALRRATIGRYATPILCGSSFKNIGVQPLMDAIIDYLPSPLEANPPEVVSSPLFGSIKHRKGRTQEKQDDHSTLPVSMDPQLGCVINNDKHLTASLAFKVISHPNRGLMTFVRVYSGKLQPNSTVINTRNGDKIKIGKLLIMNGDIPQEVKSLTAGNIGVITGTDEISTGDTLISHSASKNVNKIPKREASARLLPIAIPPPVFSVSIEPTTVADRRKLESSLQVLLREDPSLRLTFDDESGQMILSGMGELHLEITRDRLITDMKVNADIGKVRVTYKETITQQTEHVTKSIASPDNSGSFSVTLSVDSFEGPAEDTDLADKENAQLLEYDNNIVVFDKHAAPEFIRKALNIDSEWPLPISYEHIIGAMISGITGALQVGGQVARLPLHSVVVKIKKWSLPVEATSTAPLLQSTRLAVREALESLPPNASTILEPLMKVSVFVNDEDLGVVTQDLMSARNAKITDIDEQDNLSTGGDALWARGQAEKTYIPYDPTLQYIKQSQSGGKKVIKGEAPLRDMIGYLSKIRSLTKGSGFYSMEYCGMQRATSDRVKQILDE